MKNTMGASNLDNQPGAATAPDQRIEISSVVPTQPEQAIKPEGEPQEKEKILKECFSLLNNAKAIRQERLQKLQEQTEHLEQGIENKLSEEPQATINKLRWIGFESSGAKIGLEVISEIESLISETEENIEGSIDEKVESLGTSKEQVTADFQKNIIPNIKAVLELFISSLEKEEKEYLLDPNNKARLTHVLLARRALAKRPELQKIVATDTKLQLVLTGNLEKPAEIGTTQPKGETLPETAERETNTLDQQRETTDKDVNGTTKVLKELRDQEALVSEEIQELKTKKDGLEIQARTTKEELDKNFPYSQQPSK